MPAVAPAGVIVGLVVLGEQLPSSRGQQALRLLAWLLILLGVGGLSGAGARDQMLALAWSAASQLHAHLPLALRARIPVQLQQALRKQEGLLPVAVNPHSQ
jgi:hypothetical protein